MQGTQGRACLFILSHAHDRCLSWLYALISALSMTLREENSILATVRIEKRERAEQEVSEPFLRKSDAKRSRQKSFARNASPVFFLAEPHAFCTSSHGDSCLGVTVPS